MQYASGDGSMGTYYLQENGPWIIILQLQLEFNVWSFVIIELLAIMFMHCFLVHSNCSKVSLHEV